MKASKKKTETIIKVFALYVLILELKERMTADENDANETPLLVYLTF